MVVSMSANGYGSPRCVGWQCPHDVVREDMTGTVRGVALVTGANRGLGLEVSRQLVEQGFWVCLGVRDLAKGEQAAKAIGNQTRALALDVANASAARGAVREIERGYGRLDVLINNAAIHDDSGVRALDPGWTTIREAFETNLFGAWRVAVACASSPVDTVDS
jgi:NAD(P)-dependent dehydrogenase (short-subunit alcohol dehydrogenase family)